MKLLLLKQDTVRLLRIPFSFFLMPVFLLSLSQATQVNLQACIWTFFIIHFLVYPSSNGYNSYVDRDETSIGGLEKPPLPTPELFYTTLLLDILAVLLAAITVNTLFALCIFLYIIASRAYSSRSIRLKKYPLPGFLVVVLFQGAFTYYMSMAGISNQPMLTDAAGIFILTACSLQIAGAYPLTQIYQHAADKAAGDITLSIKLGLRGTFVFTAMMLALCDLFYYLYFDTKDQPHLFLILQVFFLPVIIYFFSWFRKVWKDPDQASYKNTMTMNLVASASMICCFTFFILLRL